MVTHEYLTQGLPHGDPDVIYTETREHEEIVRSLRGYSRKNIRRDTVSDIKHAGRHLGFWKVPQIVFTEAIPA